MDTHAPHTLSPEGIEPPVRPPYTRPLTRWQVHAWLALGYAALAAFSVAMARQPGSLAVLWFANAWAVPLWMSLPRAQWPGMLAVQGGVNAAVGMAFGDGVGLAVTFALANGAEVALVAAILQRRMRGRTEDWAPERIMTDFLVCRVLPIAAGAAFGAGILAMEGLGTFSAVLPVWFLGSLFGHLTLAFPLRYVFIRGLTPWVGHDIGALVLTVAVSAVMVITLPRPFIYVAGVMVVGLLAMRPSSVAIAVAVLGLALSFAHAWEANPLPAEAGWWGGDEDLLRLMAVMLVANALLLFKLRNEHQIELLANEQRSVQTLSRQNAALLSSSTAGLMCARNRVIEWVNPAFARMLGYAEAELVGQSTRLMYADEADFVAVGREGYADLARHGSFTRQVQCLTKGGQRVHWVIKGAYLEGDAGVVYVSCTDVTDAETKRQELDVALKSAGLGYFEFDAVSMTSFWDATLCRLYGLGDHPQGLTLPSERFFELLVTEEKAKYESFLNVTAESLNVQFVIRRPDGELRHIEGCSVNQFDAAGQLVRRWGFERDVTQRHQQSQALRDALKAAQSADEAKGHFLNNMSHEMRTPLNGLLGYTQVLADTELTSTQRSLLTKMHRAGKGLLGLINDVLDFSKLQSGEFSLHAEPLHVRQVAKEALDIVQPLAEAKGVCLRVQPMAPQWTRARLGDAQRVRQMLLNLLSNAVKFTPSGGHITLAVSGEGDACRFEVTDTGTGIAPDELHQLFQRFHQLDNSGTRVVQGTGLGLAIVKELAQKMGGDVAVTSTLGQGTSFAFWVNLPATDSAVTPPVDPVHGSGQAARGERPPLSGMRVLVVDDSEMNVDVASHLLTTAGAQVHTAGNGQEALDWLAAHPNGVDVVLMDLHMPVMDGLEASRRIREMPAWAHLPLVALTAGSSQEDKRSVRAVGMNDYVLKPYHKADLLATLLRHGRRAVGSRGLDVHQPQAHAAGVTLAGVTEG